MIRLVDDEYGWVLELPAHPDLARKLALQVRMCGTPEAIAAFQRHLAGVIWGLVPWTFDYELRPPSPAQVSYARDIARGLEIDVHPDVFEYRGLMHLFLEQHVPIFREACERTRNAKRRKVKAALGHATDRVADDPGSESSG